MTFHPSGLGSLAPFDAAPWLDFDSLQTSHYKPNIPGYLFIERLFNTYPVKPCIDREPNYELSPFFVYGGRGKNRAYTPVIPAYDVRTALYRTVLAGAAGSTDGCEPIRQLAARRAFTRRPAQELFKPICQSPPWADRLSVGIPSAGLENTHPAAHVSVAACTEGTYLLAYAPVRQVFDLDTSGLASKRLRVTLHDPQTCRAEHAFEAPDEGTLRVLPERDLDTFVTVDAA